MIEIATFRFFRESLPETANWILIAIYFLVSVLCFRAASTVGTAGTNKAWIILAGVTFFLGVNKGFEAQTLLIRAGRAIALAQQWYGYRREVQLLFLIALLFVTGAASFAFVRHYWPFLQTHVVMTGGLGVILVYCVLRAADINHVELFGSNRTTSDFLWPLEAFGLALMLFGAGKALTSQRSVASTEALGRRR